MTDEHQQFLEQKGAAWTRPEPITAAEALVELAGRICYMSFGPSKQSPRSNAQYIRNLIEQGHESVLEHASWSFILSGVSRAFTHQLVRHRIGFSYSQLSQQYHDESEADFVQPAELEESAEAQAIWKAATDTIRQAYECLIKDLTEVGGAKDKERLRAIRSASRSILPAATETSIFVSANARALRHFLDVRGSIIGDIEMRRVSALILEVFSREAPSLFADFKLDRLDGEPLVTKFGAGLQSTS